MEGREIDNAQHLGSRDLGQLQGQVAGVGQRALRADQQVRQVDAAVFGVRPLALVLEDVQVVAADPAQHLRPAPLDLGAVRCGQVAHELRYCRGTSAELADRPELDLLAA